MECSNFSLVAIHILDGCFEYIRKNLKDDWYFFSTKYKIGKNGRIEKNCERNKVIDILYGRNINVYAIVGKNGSGKSSVMEIVYRMMNNLSYVMTHGMQRPAADNLVWVDGVYAELYFESYGKLGVLTCRKEPRYGDWGQILFQWGDDNIKRMDSHYGEEDSRQSEQDRLNVEYISKYFCYTLVSNYAMMSLFSEDYCEGGFFHRGNWLDSLYNKNDGYQAAIGIEPYKGNGKIDLHIQKDLFYERVSALAIYNKRHDKPLFDDYKLDKIEFSLNGYFLSDKFEKEGKWSALHPEKELASWIKARKSQIARHKKKTSPKTIAECIIEQYGFAEVDMEQQSIAMALSYLAIKTLSITEKYPQYHDKYRIIADKMNYKKGVDAFWRKMSLDDKQRVAVIVDTPDSSSLTLSTLTSELLERYLCLLCQDILTDSSHITKKIRQTILFIDAIKDDKKEHKIDFHTFTQEDYFAFTMRGDENELNGLDAITEYLPPPFFDSTIYLKKEDNSSPIAINRLSTGERQFLQTTVSLIYHIKNILSVTRNDGWAKYHSVVLFLDEMEICFHPDYQKKFLKKFIDMITLLELNANCGINIIFATHSPFILSDIPQDNILYLKDGQNLHDVGKIINPFCANVNDILHQSFFMDKGFVGDYAIDVVKDVYEYLETGESKRQWDAERVKGIIELIGEPLLRSSLMRMYVGHISNNQTEKMIEWHEKELDRLKKSKRTQYEKD